MYLFAVEFKNGPRFGFFVLKTGPRVVLKTAPLFIVFPIFIVFFGHVLKHK